MRSRPTRRGGAPLALARASPQSDSSGAARRPRPGRAGLRRARRIVGPERRHAHGAERRPPGPSARRPGRPPSPWTSSTPSPPAGRRARSARCARWTTGPPTAWRCTRRPVPARSSSPSCAPSAITCSLSTYTAIVGGSTPWTRAGRPSCGPRPWPPTTPGCPPPRRRRARPGQHRAGHGQGAGRRAGGYLVGVRLTVVVPPQKMANGQRRPAGSRTRRWSCSRSTAPATPRWARSAGAALPQERDSPASSRVRSNVAMRSRCAAASP